MRSARTGRPGWTDWSLDVRAPVRLDQTAGYSWKTRLLASGALFVGMMVWIAGRKRWQQQA